MSNFDFNKFKYKNIAVNCETYDEAVHFIKMCNENGIFFVKEFNYFFTGYNFGDKTCYSYDSYFGICDCLRFGDIKFYKKEKYEIIKFSDINFKNKLLLIK